MKQKMIFIVLLAAGIYLPAGSKECGKVCMSMQELTTLKIQAVKKPSVVTEEISSFPASPFSKSLINL